MCAYLVKVLEQSGKNPHTFLERHHLHSETGGRQLINVKIIFFRLGSKVATSPGQSKRIFVAEFRPDSDTMFVTCGVKHVMFWQVTGGTLTGKKGVLAQVGPDEPKMQTMLSVGFGVVSFLHDSDL